MKYLVVILLSVINLFAIVSIAPVAIGENPGLSGMVEGALKTQKGNTDSDNYTAGAKLAYDNNKSYVMWSEFDFNYGKASGVKNANATFAHLRYIHKLEKNLDWEVFVQSQTNEFTKVAERFLTGGGLRIHLNEEHYGSLYFGFGGFYEYLSYTTTVDPKENNIRGNFYIAYKKKFIKDSQISYVAYYQPKVGDISDYIILNSLELKVQVYEKVYITFLLSYNKDVKPAQGVKRADFSQSTSFSYKF